MKYSRPIRATVKDVALVNERRRLIVDKAVDLFLAKGYQKTTTKEIAEACGMSAGSLYQYIGAKEDILHLGANQSKQSSETLRRYVDEAPEEDIIANLQLLIRKSVEKIDNEDTKDKNWSSFINREIAHFPSDDKKELLDSMEENVLSYELLLNRGIEVGLFKVRYPFLLAHEIVMVEQNWLLRKWLLGKRFTREEYIRTCTENILDPIMVDRADSYREQVTSERET